MQPLVTVLCFVPCGSTYSIGTVVQLGCVNQTDANPFRKRLSHPTMWHRTVANVFRKLGIKSGSILLCAVPVKKT